MGCVNCGEVTKQPNGDNFCSIACKDEYEQELALREAKEDDSWREYGLRVGIWSKDAKRNDA